MRAMLKSAGMAMAGAVILAGCAVTRPEGRHLSRPLTGENWPESRAAQVALAPVAGTALALDAVVVNPLLAVPESAMLAHEMTVNTLEYPREALVDVMWDPLEPAWKPLTWVPYAPLWLVGTVISFPDAMIWHLGVPEMVEVLEKEPRGVEAVGKY